MSSLISPSSPGSAGSSSPPSSPPTPPSPNLASRPVRSTRGRRLTDLHGEGDDEFWQQEFFTAAQDDDEDFDVRQEADAEGEDVVDSDFFDSEDEEEAEEAEAEEKEAKRGKRKGQYVDPRAAKKPKVAAPRAKPKAAAPQSQPVTTTPTTAAMQSSTSRVSSPSSLLLGLGGVRKSSRSSTMSASVSLHLKEEQRRRSTRSLQRGKLSFPVRTQREQLDEAVETERLNRESLQQLLRIEEERKKVHLRKKRGKGPTVLLHSSAASTSLSWSTTATLPAVFSERPAPLPYVRCVVSNAPARYLHRWTGQPFRGVAEWRAMEEAWRRGEKFVNAEQAEREKEERERDKRKHTRRTPQDRDDAKGEAEAAVSPHEEGREAAAIPASAGQQKRPHKKRARGAVEEVGGGKEEAEAPAGVAEVEEGREVAAAAEEEGGAGGASESRKGSPTSASARTAKRAKTSKAGAKSKGK